MLGVDLKSSVPRYSFVFPVQPYRPFHGIFSKLGVPFWGGTHNFGVAYGVHMFWVQHILTSTFVSMAPSNRLAGFKGKF